MQNRKLFMTHFFKDLKNNSLDITKSLRAIGIEKVFDQQGADLSPMLGDDSNGFVKKVNHAVKFEIDEKGVEGAAVTSALISRLTPTPSPCPARDIAPL